MQPYREKKKSFAARPHHLTNELAACHRDLTKLASVQEMMQGVIVMGWKGRKVSKTLANDVANGPLTPTDGRTDAGKKKRTGQTPSHFSSTLRLRPASQSVRSTHLLTPLSPGYTHATELRFLGGSAALRRAGNSSR